uniref:Uncharacterized protein n=1 Tax=Panagrolaimus davidi TaxID=227884 RepID=A0A914Q7M5_9BILA
MKFEKWLKCLEEWDDSEFVITNIEKKLSENIFDKELWKDYIKYLKKIKNTNAMLGVYSRYCGLFLNDSKMEKEFLNEAEKNGVNVGDELLDYKEFYSILPFQLPVKYGPCETKIDLSTTLSQNFALPNKMLKYLMKNVGILQKLQKSCKQLFLLQPTPICHRFVIASRPIKNYFNLTLKTHQKAINFDEQSLTINSENPELDNLENLYLTNYVYIGSIFNVLRLSNILKCVQKCEIKYLTIENQTLFFKDYQLLTEAKSVKEIKFLYSQIWKNNGFLAQLEDIMENLPNAVHIE